MHSKLRSSRAHISLASLGAASLMLCACGTPLEVDLPPANREIEDPGDASWLATRSLDAFLDLAAAAGLHSGYVAMFARDGHVVHATASGYADIEAGLPMRLDTRFRMASMTKPLTATAALLLIEKGRLGLDDPIARYIPAASELRIATSLDLDATGRISTVPLERPLTVRDLLTFSAGIGARGDPSPLGQLWAERDIYAGQGSLEDRVNRILTAPLYEQPGERWRYGWSADVLARIVEVVADEPFGQFLARRIFVPLGMSSSSFVPADDEHGKLAQMYTQDEDQNLVVVEIPTSEALDWTPGGGGLIAPASDYMRFALMLWNGGSYDGVQILSQQSIAHMTRLHVDSGVLAEEQIDGLGWGLGLAVVADADATPMVDRTGDFWWSGYYGTTFFVSPETGLVGVVLTQNQPGPHSDRPYPVYLAQAFAFFGL